MELLVGDDLVSMDKIGTSNFYWSLKSEHANKLRKKRAALEAELSATTAARDELAAKVAAAKAERPDTEARAAAAAALTAVQTRHAALSADMKTYAANDPEVLQRIAAMKPLALEAANRWTDNAFMVKQWMQRTAGAAPDAIAGFFKSAADIDIESLDYVSEDQIVAKLAKAAKGASKKSGGGVKRKAAEE